MENTGNDRGSGGKLIGFAIRIYMAVACIAAGMLFLPDSAFAATITIGSGQTITHQVSGNGDINDNGSGSAGDPNGNTVEVKDSGSVTTIVVGGFKTASGSINGSNNNVNITNSGNVTGTIYGMYANSTSGNGATVTATNNRVTIDNGTAGNLVYGAYDLTSTANSTANASSNTVTVKSGNVAREIYGGFASALGNTQHVSRAEGNTVIIEGGTVGRDIYGGYTSTNHTSPNPANMHANNNTVTISGTPDLSASTIYGGRNTRNGVDIVGTVYTGNTFNLLTSGITVKSVKNFQNLNFYLASDYDGTTTLLTVTESTSLANTTIAIGFTGSGPQFNLEVADEITLVSGPLTGTPDNVTLTGAGVSYVYGFDLNVSGSELKAVVNSKNENSSAQGLSSGVVAGVSTLAFGGSLVAGTGMSNFLSSFPQPGRAADLSSSSSSAAYASPVFDCGWSRMTAFAAIEGGSYRVDVGHSINVDGVSGLVGLGWMNRGAAGNLAIGAFFEAGYSSFDDKPVFDGVATKGDGNARYAGGGILGRFDWHNGAYVEGSFRAGGINNRYHGNMRGTRVEYDITSAYLGAHAGLGYRLGVGCDSVLDMSVKYLWTRQGSDNDIVNGEKVNFESAESHRVRAGARYSYNVSSRFSPYAGAQYEYEFDGKARAATSQVNFGTPSAKGGTGIGEVGFVYRNNNFSADLGIQGHVGKRDGVSGSLKVGWAF